MEFSKIIFHYTLLSTFTPDVRIYASFRKLQALTLHPDTHNGWKLSHPSSTSLIKLRFNVKKINHDWRFVISDIMPCRWQLLTFRVTTVLPPSGSCSPKREAAQEDTGESGRWWTGISSGLALFIGLGEPVDSSKNSVKFTSRHGATRTRFESSANPLSEPQNTASYVLRNNAVTTASLNKSRINEPCVSRAHTSAMYRSLSARLL